MSSAMLTANLPTDVPPYFWTTHPRSLLFFTGELSAIVEASWCPLGRAVVLIIQWCAGLQWRLNALEENCGKESYFNLTPLRTIFQKRNRNAPGAKIREGYSGRDQDIHPYPYLMEARVVKFLKEVNVSGQPNLYASVLFLP